MCKYTSIILFLSIICMSASFAQVQEGTASYYSNKFEGKQTASGEKYKHHKLTAAHKTLPFGTVVLVTNLSNNQSVQVRINDRGPFVTGRIIDLSRAAAQKLLFINQGLAEVKIEVIDAGDGRSLSNSKMQIDRSVKNETYFKMKVRRQNPSGFGVQIGSFKGFDNMLRLSENINKSYGPDLYVEIKDVNETKVYALILGDYKTRKKADKMKAKIADRFPDAFVTQY